MVLQAIAGPDPHDPTTLRGPVPDFCASVGESLDGLRIGWDDALDQILPDLRIMQQHGQHRHVEVTVLRRYENVAADNKDRK